MEREKQLKDHQLYKEACNDLVAWITKTRESLPTLTKSLGDRLALESGLTALEVGISLIIYQPDYIRDYFVLFRCSK